MKLRCPWLPKTRALLAFVALFFAAPALADHETIVIDGNLTDLIDAVDNNLGSANGGFKATNALGNIYSPSCAFVNGFDLRNTYAFFDFRNPDGSFESSITLYLGWEVEGMIGDVDGNGNPSTFTMFDPQCANNGDQAGVGAGEAYKFFADAGCDFTNDVEICVMDNSVIVNGNVVPGASFVVNGSFLEVKVPDYQSYLPGDPCDARFFMTANAQFDGLGEDASPQFNLNLPPSITVTKTPPTQTSCPGSEVTWTVTVTNNGLCTLNQVSVRDTLDAGLSFVSSIPAPAGGSGQVRTWTFTDLAPGASQVITLTAGMPETCGGTLVNRVTAEGVIDNPCRTEGPQSVEDNTSAEVICRETPCDISGDLATCIGNTETYTTTVDVPFSRQWSVTSTPPGICNIVGGTTGPSLEVEYTGAGVCTVSLTVTDPIDPQSCVEVCTQLVTVNPPPPCDIAGDAHVCVGNDPETYTTTVGAEYTRVWSATSTPPGICSFVGGDTGGSVQVQFTGAGQCTLTLTVTDPNDPDDCGSVCTKIIDIDAAVPCDISGVEALCLGKGSSEVYTTTVGAEYNRIWSGTSTPPGICSIDGGNTGGSVTLDFTGAGQCTLTLTVTDPNDPDDCGAVCTKIITISDTPACDISGDDHVCVGNENGTYTTTVGAEFNRSWSGTSTPPGICSIIGSTTGGSVEVEFTGAGQCTLTLTVTNPDNPDCTTNCTKIITVGNPPPCDITGDGHVCVGNDPETYTTTVGAEYNRVWSGTSTPPGICSIVGGNTGGSVQVQFTGAGTCTLTLTVTDPSDPEDCGTVCTKIITIDEPPPCNIEGSDALCLGTGTSATYSTTVGDAYVRAWSATSTPPGICNIEDVATGPAVTINFTGAGQCTVTLTVTDPNDPNDCGTVCTKIVTISNVPDCNISGDDHVCVGNANGIYTTTVGPEFNRSWSGTSNPPGICSIVGSTTGGSVEVQFTGAGVCTLSLTVTNPDNRSCTTTCTKIITVDNPPPCAITGPESICKAEQAVFTAEGAGVTNSWSAVSDPPGICSFVGGNTGNQVTLSFTAAGTCTLTLNVASTGDPEDCTSTCTKIITIDPCDAFACPHTIGFWRQQCAQKSGGSTKVCKAGMDNLWRCVIDATDVIQWRLNDGNYETTASLRLLSNSTLFTRLCSQLEGPRPMTNRDMAEVQYLGLMLNVCSGALPTNIVIAGVGTVQQAIDGIENALNTGTDINYWKTVADNINNRIGVEAADCPGGNDLFKNIEPCNAADAIGNLDPSSSGDPNVFETRAFPNPIRSNATSIFFNIPSHMGSADVEIVVFDVAGRVVKNLLSDTRDAGQYTVDWDLRDEGGAAVASGIFFYRLTVGAETVTQKLMVLRK